MASGRRKMKVPSKVRAARKVSRPKKLPASMGSLAGATSTALFTAKELDKFNVLRTEPDFVMVRCGVTSHTFGDYAGRMKIYRDGAVRITCECFDGCTADNMTIVEFENHTKPPVGQSNCRTGAIWTLCKNGNKLSMKRSGLLKYYKGSPHDPSVKTRPRENPNHRDEFVKCTKCNKHRRFALATRFALASPEEDESRVAESREACKTYHDASISVNWTCADHPDKKYSCEDIDERTTKMNFRGCQNDAFCSGCPSCVCFGCYRCRFEGCDCRTCVDFINNAGTQNTNGQI